MKLINGDSLYILNSIAENKIDALVTDPPAGISFMGKGWDDDKGGRKQWITWMTEVMQECHRVMKPGAHGLVWALPRTSHWTATALEDAGFEIRDVVTHLFGTGFPKSHNIEKATGDDRFKGVGTALKPASEHWILIRKTISEKTVAANVLKWGVGGLNIDASRIAVDAQDPNKRRDTGGYVKTESKATTPNAPYNSSRAATLTEGRFPANLVLSHSEHCLEDQCDIECAIKMLDGQSDGASRFFYCSKASKSDKGSENFHPTVKSTKLMSYLIKLITPPSGVVLDPFMGSGSTGIAAVNGGFEFVGIEREKEYFEIAKKRLEDING